MINAYKCTTIHIYVYMHARFIWYNNTFELVNYVLLRPCMHIFAHTDGIRWGATPGCMYKFWYHVSMTAYSIHNIRNMIKSTNTVSELPRISDLSFENWTNPFVHELLAQTAQGKHMRHVRIFQQDIEYRFSYS